MDMSALKKMMVGRTWKAKKLPRLPSLPGLTARSPKTKRAPSVVKFSTRTKNELTQEKNAFGQPSGAKKAPISSPLRMNTARMIWRSKPAPTSLQLMFRRPRERRKAMDRMTARPRIPRKSVMSTIEKSVLRERAGNGTAHGRRLDGTRKYSHAPHLLSADFS